MLRFKRATNNNEKKAIFQLRYQVYCLEKNYLSTNNYEQKMEYDEWDEHSALFMASTPTSLIGTARLIEDSPLGFPIETLFNVKTPKDKRKSFAEFSRLIISSEYRLANYQVAYGIYCALYQYSVRNNITHWYAVLDSRLLKLYRRTGFLFVQLGEAKECFGGVTAPYCLSLADTMENLKTVNPSFHDYLAGYTKPQPQRKIIRPFEREKVR